MLYGSPQMNVNCLLQRQAMQSGVSQVIQQKVAFFPGNQNFVCGIHFTILGNQMAPLKDIEFRVKKKSLKKSIITDNQIKTYQKAFCVSYLSFIEISQLQTWIATPCLVQGSPAPQTVCKPQELKEITISGQRKMLKSLYLELKNFSPSKKSP